MNPIYKIAKWRETFETANSRRNKSLPWVSVPTGFNSNGYTMMIERFGEKSPPIYGAWMALVSIAASCPVRGLLCNSKGVGHSVGRLSMLSHFPNSAFEVLFEFAIDPDVEWLVEVSEENAKNLIEQLTLSGEQPLLDSQTASDRQSVALPNLTDPTKPNQTSPNQTGNGSIDGLRKKVFDLDWDIDEMNQRIKRWRKVSKMNSRSLPGTLIGCVVLLNEAGLNLSTDLVSRLSEGTVRKPEAYCKRSIGNAAKQFGVDGKEALEVAMDRMKNFAAEIEVKK